MTFTFSDRLIVELDRGLRTLFAPAVASRPLPVASAESPTALSKAAIEVSGRLMRVNHSGEICAQALYQGQALFARNAEVRAVLLSAAAEERDHLAWCESRLDQLGASVSVLNPIWYAGSFALGMASGWAGDRWSLGFLVETERQVEHHLDGHLARIAPEDLESRAILSAMQADEIRHGQAGESHGAAELPAPVRATMKVVSQFMTRTSHWL